MPLQIDIPDQDIQYLNDPAKAELRSSTSRYVTEVLQEAGRLEATQNTVGGNPEITSSMIRDAIILLKRGYKKPKPPLGMTIMKIIASVSSLVVGLMFDYEELKKPTLLALFIILLVVAVTFSVLVITKE